MESDFSLYHDHIMTEQVYVYNCNNHVLEGDYSTGKKKFSYYVSKCSSFTVVFVFALIKKTVKMLVKSLINCNRNCQGQPAGLNWLIVAAVYIYMCSPLKRQKVDTISYPLITLLFGSLSCIFCLIEGVSFLRK